MENTKLDKTAFSVSDIDEIEDEKQFWFSKSPAERLEAVEIMRQIIYGYDETSARFQRFFEIADHTQG